MTHKASSLPVTAFYQRGLTLVEVMIAVTISLLIIAGILQISMSSKETYRIQTEQGYVQENLRLATSTLNRDLRMAGFRSDSTKPLANGAALVAHINGVDGGTDSDTITIAYESNTDCLGQATPAVTADKTRAAVNRYYVQNLQLMCLGNGNVAPQPLVDGVEAMQILYGEDTDGLPRSANRYVQFGTIADINNITSVRVALRFRSLANFRPTNDTTTTYVLLDEAALGPYNDKLLRRSITSTVALRN